MRASRDEWARRVERWRDSGLTAEEFANELDIKVSTLRYWGYKLGKAGVRPRKATHRVASQTSPLVEVTPTIMTESRFELELRGGRRVCVPSGFDAGALKRLLAVLEDT